MPKRNYQPVFEETLMQGEHCLIKNIRHLRKWSVTARKKTNYVITNEISMEDWLSAIPRWQSYNYKQNLSPGMKLLFCVEIFVSIRLNKRFEGSQGKSQSKENK